ncbi:hypothetical protein KC316_g4312 [Hortaea werneckii]|uniref:Uncharacterized protein n=1 Tax=Hortaea werneckii TaxID=91943 RepID=A0A3M6XZ07_HORWE|nr:hypothetical protein KC355_g12153 [Hortaea werneckii]KAI7588763.1 hypothetical protein KC316_g4312 [Hortaea werneckii]RMX96005.1 hypothetical protein D0867_13300 [Hortaea werneckii]RMX96025.1 hypothetical protein D0868_11407 [Hortaea werneckii]
MTTSHIPEQSGSRHSLPGEEGGGGEEDSTVKKQKNHHDIRSSSTPDDPSREASRADPFSPDNTSPTHPVRLAEPSASALLHAADEYQEHHVRDAGLPRVSERGHETTIPSVAAPERLEGGSHFPPLEHRGERSPEHQHHHRHHDGPPTPVRRHTVLHEESEAHDDDDNAAPPHPHLQLPGRSPQRRGRIDLSPPPPPLKSPNASASVVGGGGEGATTGHQRSSSAPVKPLKSAFAAPKSPPLTCSSPSSETGGGGSGATSPSTAGTKKRARFEDEDRGLEGGVGVRRGRGELELMLGRGLGGPGRSLFLGEDQEEEEAGFAERTLIEEDDDGEDVDLPASSRDEGEVDDDARLEVGAGDPETVRQISSDESVRDVLQTEVDNAADEFHEDAAEREDASMGERDSASVEDDVRDDEEQSLDLRDDIVSPLQDPAYDQEGSDQEDEGTSGFALAEHDQATDNSRTRFFDDQDQLNDDVGLDHPTSQCRHFASIDEGKATQRARLPFFSRPEKPANTRRLSDSQAERDLQNDGIVPRRASSMGDFNSLYGRPTPRPLPAKAAPAGVALTATSVHPAEQHKINPIYQHPNARWRHDVYDSRKPTRTEQTVYSGGTKYQILWEEPPQSDTDSDTTLIMEENVETPQVVEPDSDSILAHISRSPSPMGKLRTKLAAWSWAKEQEELGMEDVEDEGEVGQGGGGRAKATSQLMPAAGATRLLSTRRRSPIEDATGSEGPPAPPNTVKSGASSAQRSAPQTPFLECRDEGGQCGIRVEAPDAFDPDTGHTVESQGEFFDVDDVGEEGEEEAGLVIGLGSSSSSSCSNAAADMQRRLLKPALSRVRSATLPPPATTTTLDYLSFPATATASSSRLSGPSLLSSSVLQQQQQHQQHHNLANPCFSRHFSNLTQEEDDSFRTHRDSVDIHHRRLNEEKMNTHLQATRDSFLITKSKYDARPRSHHNPYLPLQQHQHPSSSLSSPTHIQYSRFGGLSPILDASPPSSEATTKQSAKAVPISSSASSKTPSGEVPVKVTVLEGEESSSEEDEPDSAAHPDEHVGCAICAVERPRWFEARQQRRKMQV